MYTTCVAKAVLEGIYHSRYTALMWHTSDYTSDSHIAQLNAKQVFKHAHTVLALNTYVLNNTKYWQDT